MWTKFVRLFGIFVIVIFCAASIFFSLAERDLIKSDSTLKKITSYPSFFEDRFYDIRMRTTIKETKNENRVVLAAIDEPTLEAYGQWPLPRKIWVQFLDKLRIFNPKVVAFDVFFVEPEKWCSGESILSPEQNFSKAIERFQSSGDRKVILPYSLNINRYGKYITDREFKEIPEELYEFMLSSNISEGNSLKKMSVSKNAWPHPDLLKSMPGLSHIEATEDSDGIYRHYFMIGNVDDLYFPSFGLQTYQYFTDDGPQIIRNNIGEAILKFKNGEMKVNQLGQSKIRWLGGAGSFPKVSIKDILQAPDDDPVMRKILENNILFIGSTAYGAHDLRHTPVDSQLPGIYLHMNIVHMLLEGKFFKSIEDSTLISWWILMAGTLLMIITQLLGKPMLDISLVLVLAIGIYFADIYYLTPQGFEIKLFFCLLSIISCYSWNTFLNFHLSNKDRAFLKGAFENYISPELIDEMYEKGEPPKLGGNSDILTAYFTDIEGFSTFSEQLSPTELVELLNEYLTAMTDILLEERGTLDKYEGDAIIAFFGAPMPLKDHAQRACRVTAIMQLRLTELRAHWKQDEKKWPDVVENMKMRIGINTGEIVTGNMGSTQRMNYTMMGDSVNLAARLEEAAKQYGIYVQISGQTLDELTHPDEFIVRKIDKIKVVGKSEPVVTYEIVTLNLDVNPYILELVDIFNKGLESYEKKNWDEAIGYFNQSKKLEIYRFSDEIKTKTTPSDVYIERCQQFKETPPPVDWDGVYVLTKK
jgi:adenylate cyclase